MEQTELFARAENIVARLTDYAVDIRGQVVRIDEAIDKKKGEIKALREKLIGIDKAIAEAQSFAAEMAPTSDPETEIPEIIPDTSTFEIKPEEE